MNEERRIVEFILFKMGCVHPFRISRILLLAEWEYNEKYRKRLTNLRYVAKPFAFYIEELKDILDNIINDKCAVLRQDMKCIEYLCSEPSLPDEVRDLIIRIIDKTSKLSDHDLNKIVVNDPRYNKLLKENTI